MMLHDAIGINYKYCATTENQFAGSSIWAKGCMLDDGVCVSDLT